MKKTIATLAMLASVNAFAGYSARVCTLTESGEEINCRMMYFDRNLGEPSKYQEPVICDGEAMNTICDKPAGVPAWLVALNKWFKDRGFSAPVDNGDQIGGPN